MIEKRFLDEYAWLGDRVYMDCSTLGLQPERTLKTAREFLDDYAYHLGRPTHGDSFSIREYCRKRLGELIHADAEDIFFTDNTTQGNNLLSSFYPFEEGDEVILGNGDFATVWLPWAAAQKKGIKPVWVQNENGVFRAEDYIQKITDRTKVIALSWVQSSSGYVTDIARLGEVCRDRGILLSVDAVQGMGRLPVDVQKMKIDILASSSFKGMLGVMGAGFCYCRREIMDKITPPVCGGNILMESLDFRPGFTEVGVPAFVNGAPRMESGTGNNYGIAVMSESVGLLLEIGVENIAAHIRELETYYRACLKRSGIIHSDPNDSDPNLSDRNQLGRNGSIPNQSGRNGFNSNQSGWNGSNPNQSGLSLQLLGSEDPATWSGSISFLCPEEYREVLKKELDRAKITIAVRQYVRVSLHYYNKKEHIDRLMEVLERVFRKEHEKERSIDA